MTQAYAVRRHAFEGPTVWALEDNALVERRPGRPERRLPLAGIRRLKLLTASAGPAAFGAGRRQRALVAEFATGRASIGSHSFRGLADLDDQTPAFAAFVRDLGAKASEAAPGVRITSPGAEPLAAFTWTVLLLGTGVAALLAAAAAAGALSLGLDLAARLAFVLCLLLALRPWLGDTRGRSFDPRDIPAEVLP